MISLKINNFQFQVRSNVSILEACKFVGIEVSRFCYHELLSISGNCRMCLVELDKAPKPVASCVTLVTPGMNIFVLTPFVQKARELIVEMLLINHPLDCPICDQGGECDLQDQVKIVGNDHNKFWFNRRAVEDKQCGPIIKTIMTRCIHCTRCVRFSSEIAGEENFGVLGRGKNTEIGFYSEKKFLSEISGNIIDLCPVGALTSKPYSFKVRPWELSNVETIDLTDGLGSSIIVDVKKDRIVRILPKKNAFLNETLITDKARFSYDSSYTNRLLNVYSLTTQINWEILLKLENNFLLKDRNVILVDSSDTSLETLIFLKLIERVTKATKVYNVKKNVEYSNSYINNIIHFNKTIDSSKIAVIISSNLKLENALINIQLRNKTNRKDIECYSLTNNFLDKKNLEKRFISCDIKSLLKFNEGKLQHFSTLLINTLNILIILGKSLENRILNINVLKTALLKANPTINFLNANLFSNYESEMLSAIHPVSKSAFIRANNILMLNLCDTTFIRKLLKNNKKIFWFNPYKSYFKSNINYLIPCNSSYEETGIFINLEKRAQLNTNSIFGITKTIPQMLNDLFKLENLNKKNLFKTNNDTRTYLTFLLEIIKDQTLFNTLQQKHINFVLQISSFQARTLYFNYPIKSLVEDFYSTTLNSKNSIIMNKCSQELRINSTNFYN